MEGTRTMDIFSAYSPRNRRYHSPASTRRRERLAAFGLSAAMAAIALSSLMAAIFTR